MSAYVKGTLTNTQPVDVAGRGVVAHHMPAFTDDFYNRIHIEPSVINAGNVSSDQTRNVSIFNGFFHPSTIDAVLEQDTQGLTLTGLSLPYLLGTLGTKQVQIVISTEGPPEIDAAYLFQFDDYPDIQVVVIGSRVIVLPYQAVAGLEESLEWACEVLTSNNGTEQRIQHRQRPRQNFSGTYHVPANEVARADNIIYGWLGKRWAIALWSESQVIEIPSPTAVIPCVTGNTDIRVAGLVMIWRSESDYEVIEVVSIGASSITLSRPTVNDYPRALLMPLRSGFGGGNAKVIKNGHTARVQMDFEVTDNILLSGVVPEQYLGEDIYYDETLMGDDGFTDQYVNRVDRVDFGTTVETYTPWLVKKVSRSTHYVFADRNESWNFRLWLHRRDGKQKPYWIPTFEANFEVAMTGIVSSALNVRVNDYKGLAEDRTHIAIQYADGSWRARAILGVGELDANTHSLALDGALNIDASIIRRISFLTLKRLDTNEVTIEWIGNACGTADIPVLEIKP